MPELSTTCRICESACGLVATVQDGRVTGLRPDPEHPVSRGFACRKGTTFHERLAAPDRLLQPRVDGEPTDWETALEAVKTRLGAVVGRYGPGAVGLYSGNAMGHSLAGVLGTVGLQHALGTQRHYSCLTLDNSEMFAVADWVFGHPLTTFVADYANADCIVLIGTDPLSSQPSQAQSHPDGPRQIRARREGLVVVDPRRSATAAAARWHLKPRVGTDVFLLAFLVGRALARNPGWPELTAVVAPFDVERVARVTGLAPEELERLDTDLERAERPLVWAGLGVLLGPHGTLGWWLVVCLARITGQFGSTWLPGGSARFRGLMRWLPVRGRDPSNTSRIGDWPSMLDTLPAATLADDVLEPGDGLRALICLGGEPLRALPDSRRAAEALEALDLLVHVGLFDGPTAERAHVVLPAASFLERDESGLHNLAQRPTAHVRRDRAVVPPAGNSRSDWAILLALADAAGQPFFGSRVLDAIARRRGPEQLVPHRWLRGPTPGRIPPARLEVPALLEALGALGDPAPTLRLVSTVRPPGAMNHWIRPNTEPGARIHPDDLAAAGLDPGLVRVRGPAGTLDLEVHADPNLAPGTLVIPFGGPVNPNQLVARDVLEPFSGQPLSNGTPVSLEPAG